MGHHRVVGSIWEGANPLLPIRLLWNESGPTQCHRQRLFKGSAFHHYGGAGHLEGIGSTEEPGQREDIGGADLGHLWAIKGLSAASGNGPTRCYRSHCFGMNLGQPNAIGNASLRGAGPIPCHLHCILTVELGQLEAGGADSR